MTTTTTPKYQVLPPMGEAEYEALREDISRHGVNSPILVDEAGDIIDGHHRKAIADELGKDCPKRRLAGLTEDEKVDRAFVLNVSGRQMTTERKRAAIASYLRRRPEQANKWVAEMLGVADETVESVRAELVAGSEIRNLDYRIGKDGKRYPAKRQPKAPVPPPDPEAVAKRQAQLDKQRAKDEKRQATERAAKQEEEGKWRADHEARGGAVRDVSKPPARVMATQDRIKAAMNDCILALTRALTDPGLDVDLIRAENEIPPDFRIMGTKTYPGVYGRLQNLTKEFGAKLKELQDAEKASRSARESPVREQQERR
jgi:hypothetical protein